MSLITNFKKKKFYTFLNYLYYGPLQSTRRASRTWCAVVRSLGTTGLKVNDKDMRNEINASENMILYAQMMYYAVLYTLNNFKQ